MPDASPTFAAYGMTAKEPTCTCSYIWPNETYSHELYGRLIRIYAIGCPIHNPEPERSKCLTPAPC